MNMKVRFSLFLTLLLTLAACSEPVPDQTPTEPVEPTQEELFKADMVMICDSVKRPEIVQTSAEERNRIAAEYIASNIRSARAKELFEAVATMDLADRVVAFNLAADDAGIQECAFVGLFLQPPQEEDADASTPAE